MKFQNAISLLVLCIIVLSLIASACGVFYHQGKGQYVYESVHGQTVSIYGRGLYHKDSVSVASQAMAQDIVTIILCIPLLIISLYLSRRGSVRGRLLLTGTLGYFLYTYTSYSFFAMYNPLFLVYVVLMSASFFAFILSMMSFDFDEIGSYFNNKLPVTLISSFIIFVAVSLGLLWLGRIIPPLIKGYVPSMLEHYTTLVIQALDLGFVVPCSIVSAVLLIKRRPLGYLLASIITIKGITMLTAITAMIIGQIRAGIRISIVEMVAFPLFNLVAVYCLAVLLKNVDDKGFAGNITQSVAD